MAGEPFCISKKHVPIKVLNIGWWIIILLWGTLRLVLFLFNSITLLHLTIKNLKCKFQSSIKNELKFQNSIKIPVKFPVNFTILAGTGILKNRPILAGNGILPGSRSILASSYYLAPTYWILGLHLSDFRQLSSGRFECDTYMRFLFPWAWIFSTALNLTLNRPLLSLSAPGSLSYDAVPLCIPRCWNIAAPIIVSSCIAQRSIKNCPLSFNEPCSRLHSVFPRSDIRPCRVIWCYTNGTTTVQGLAK